MGDGAMGGDGDSLGAMGTRWGDGDSLNRPMQNFGEFQLGTATIPARCQEKREL